MRKRSLLLLLLLSALLLCGGARGEVVISEVCAANKCSYLDADGKTPDWVELYNSGDEAVELDGWLLSDDEQALRTLPLDGQRVEAGGYLLVGLSSDTFKLDKDGETVYLFRNGEQVSCVPCPALEDDVTWALLDGTYQSTWLPTPGMANRLLAEGERFPVGEGLRFNEVLTNEPPANETASYDYIELMADGRTVDTRGWTVRLGMAGSRVYTLETKSVKKGHFTYFYCTTKSTGRVHASFGLPAQGAILSLWDSEGELVDFLRLPEQYPSVSWGLSGDGKTWGYLASQTPGKANGQVYPSKLAAPTLSLPGGVYDGGSVTVAVTAEDGAVIRYTTDGTTPKATSPVYKEPLTFTSTTALSTAAFSEDRLTSDVTCATYVLDLEADVPVVCLIIDKTYLYHTRLGLLTGKSDGKSNYRKNWEYPANLEYFNKDGVCELDQACGFGIQGDSSRGYKQKAFQLVARTCYGTDDTFDFAPFSDREATSYHTLNLRAAGSEGTGNLCTYFRDAFLGSLADEGTSLLASAGTSVMVYLNGEPYGHYNLRERIDKWSIARRLGIKDKDEIDQIDLLVQEGKARSGSSADYRALSDYMKKHDLNDPEALQYVLDRLDEQSLFEYVAFLFCCGNEDLKNNRFFRVPGGKWTWLVYDMDKAFKDASSDRVFRLYTMKVSAPICNSTDHVSFAALMQVPEMKDRFLTILGDLLADTFMPEHVIERIDAWHDMVAPTIPTQLRLWAKKNTVAHWEAKVEELRTFAKERPAYVIRYTKKYFGLTDEQVRTYFARYYEKLEQSGSAE